VTKGIGMCSLRPMVGNATLTIARSATVMKNETARLQGGSIGSMRPWDQYLYN